MTDKTEKRGVSLEGQAIKQKQNLFRRIWRERVSWAMMAPYLFFYLMTTLIPAIVSICLSFTYFNMFTSPDFVGLDNYIRMFLEDDVFMIALGNTLIFAIVTGPLSYILCFILAWIINDLNPKIRAVVTLIFYAPSISSTVYVVWKFILSPDSYGLVNGFLMKLGFINQPILWFSDPELALGLLMIVQLWLSLGVGFLAFIAGLQNVDRSLYECGAIDGIRNRWQELWYITFPQMKPMLLFGAVTQITAAFAVGPVSMELCGFPSVDYSAHTLLVHANDYGSVRYQMGYAAAVCVVLFILILVTYNLAKLALSRVGK